MQSMNRPLDGASSKIEPPGPSVQEFVKTLADFSLRPMTTADLPAVMSVETRAYAVPWPEATYWHELEFGTRSYFYLLACREQVIGYSGMWHFVDEVHLGTIVVHPALQRRGLGNILLANVIQQAIQLHTQTVTLEVRPSNVSARHLYEKFGFEEVGRRKNYYRDHEDAIIMTTAPLASPSYRTRLAALVDDAANRLMALKPEAIVNLLT